MPILMILESFTIVAAFGGLWAVVNAAAFFVMLLDKRSAKRPGAARISEATIFFLAVAFGSVGILAGMLLLRHKTRTWHFMIGIPLLVIENMATLLVAYRLVSGNW